MTNVLIVEDSQITRESFERQLAANPDYSLVASITNAANAEIACMRSKIDLILMDVCTADGESGLEAAGKIKKNYPDTKVIIMTSMPEHSFLQKAKDAECDSFWYKEEGELSLTEVCDRTMRGEYVWPEKTPSVKIGMVDSSNLSDRELDVIRALAQGCKYEEIAEQMGLSTNTVKYHIKNILQKTGYRSRVELIADVVEKRLILPKY